MTPTNWWVRPGSSLRLAEIDPGHTGQFRKRDEAEVAMNADLDRLRDLQEMLYIDDRYAVLLILQGMDTSGKDGMVRHLSKGVDLIGAELTSFKAPTSTELQHDFLWRIHQRVPDRGRIGIFNRSHYEDVLIVRVHNLVPPEVWGRRYDQINAFEQMLVENNTVVLKCYLHISKEEQKERLQARLDNPAKLYKWDPTDLEQRAIWEQYQEAYEVALSKCSTEHAPWHIIPADRKWYRNYAVTRLLVETLEGLSLQLPKPKVDPSAIRIE